MVDGGAPVPDFVTTALTRLCDRGLVALANPQSGVARARATNAGADRFEQLCRQALGISAAQFMAFRWVPPHPASWKGGVRLGEFD